MTPADVDAARALLRGPLAGSVVLGSFGLALHGARSFDDVPDLDVLADLADVPEMGRALLYAGFSLWSWRHEVSPKELTRALLAGRIYLRAHGPLTIDVTYEGIDVAAWRTDAVVIDGVTVGTVERIERQRAKKAADDARR